MSKLRIRNGPYAGRERTLRGESVSIGRDAQAGVQILDRAASRFHAEVFPVGGMYFVHDLDSKNGTYVNDERLTDEELLREGDIIKIGTTELIFESGIALNDEDSSDRIAYNDDADLLSNTLEFRIDDLSDIADEAGANGANEGRSLQILYQVGKLLSQPNQGNPAMKVLDFLIKAMPAESALIFLREGSSGKLVPHTVRTVSSQVNPVICRTIIRRTVAENRAFFTADAQDDERFNRKESVITQGIRSVVCVPLNIGGQNRGVLYLARSVGAGKFDKSDMEVVSACAIQLGVAFHAYQREAFHQRQFQNALSATVRCVESGSGYDGLGELAANAARALAHSLRLSPAAAGNVTLAARIHHLPVLSRTDDCEAVWDHFAEIGALDNVVVLTRTCHERLDGSGPLGLSQDQLDSEQRIVALAIAFAEAVRARPEVDSLSIIDGLAANKGFDGQLVAQMQACHLDGSLHHSQAAIDLANLTTVPTTPPTTAVRAAGGSHGTEALAGEEGI